jgi:TolB-like protein/Tfp pilus assembly protein PilF
MPAMLPAGVRYTRPTQGESRVTDGPRDGEEASVWQRLRRRKVVQWGIAYAAGAWGFLQGLQYVGDAFGWPAQLRQLAIIGLLVGLPVVLVLAWYHGDRGQQRVTRIEFAIITLLFLLGGGLFWRYQHTAEPSTTTVATASSPTAPTTASPAEIGPSIAVLPFDNRSAKKDDAFFVDGIHDDILTQLSKVSALKVISRTSVEQFRGTKLPVKDIAQQLGVKSILEGGVQRGGDRVRINVQLIDAGTDTHLWAETYDRELTAENIFAIQSEVAESIAGALNTALTPGEKAQVNAIPTRNLEAWEAYQLGRQRMQSRTSVALADAEHQFRRALKLDPEFALAYVGLADTLRLQAEYSGRPYEPAMAEAESAIAQALEINPNLGEAWASNGGLAMSRGQRLDAERLLHRALELNPNYATAHQWLSYVLRPSNELDEELEHAERAVQLDPLSAIVNINLGGTLARVGRFDDASARYLKAVEIDPSSAIAVSSLADLAGYARNRFTEALPLAERAVALDQNNPLLAVSLAIFWLELNDVPQAQQLITEAAHRWPENYSVIDYSAAIAASLGHDDAAERDAAMALAGYARDVYSLRWLRNIDLQRRVPATAQARYAAAFPEWSDSETLRVDGSNYMSAIDLALVLQRLDKAERAAALLDASEQMIRSLHRLTFTGYGVADVQIHALRGDKAKALTALREAERVGWRGPLWRYYRDIDPNLDSIRDDPEFKAVFADIERDMDRQRAELAARPKDALVPLEGAGS